MSIGHLFTPDLLAIDPGTGDAIVAPLGIPVKDIIQPNDSYRGTKRQEVLDKHPGLTREQLEACISFSFSAHSGLDLDDPPPIWIAFARFKDAWSHIFWRTHLDGRFFKPFLDALPKEEAGTEPEKRLTIGQRIPLGMFGGSNNLFPQDIPCHRRVVDYDATHGRKLDFTGEHGPMEGGLVGFFAKSAESGESAAAKEWLEFILEYIPSLGYEKPKMNLVGKNGTELHILAKATPYWGRVDQVRFQDAERTPVEFARHVAKRITDAIDFCLTHGSDPRIVHEGKTPRQMLEQNIQAVREKQFYGYGYRDEHAFPDEVKDAIISELEKAVTLLREKEISLNRLERSKRSKRPDPSQGLGGA